MFDRLESILAAKEGNIALSFALLFVPIAVGVGAAIDFSVAYNVRTELQTAADSAAVGALAEQSVGVIAGLTQGKDGEIAEAERDAERMFVANLPSQMSTYLSSYSVDVQRKAETFYSTVNYQANVPTTFLRLLGINSMDVAGKASGSYVPATYIDFYLMLDNSPSMGLGATTGDISTLEANTPDKCGFACHIEGSTNDYYSLAKKLGVTTRIQLVSQAAQGMMATAKKTRRYVDQYRMAVYSMGDKATDVKLTNISSMSSDLDSVSKKTASIDLMSIPYQGYDNDQQTDFALMLSGMTKEVGTGGSGLNNKDRQKVLFFVSDGVNDSYKPSGCLKKTTSGRCQQPLDPTWCKAMKDANVRIAVLYTTYQPIENNGWYKTWIKPFRPEINPAMEACATPGLFFEVSPSQGIQEALNALFLKVVNMPKLTG